MHRVSVTTIEKFRRYMTEASPFDDEEALVESIKGIFVGNDKTKVGEAYHLLMQAADVATDGQLYKAGDIIFTREQALPALRYHQLHPHSLHETPVRKIYHTKYGPIQVSGKLDEIEGQLIRDAKCKFRNVDFKEYDASCQWKFYLDMMEAERFVYDLFEFRGFKELTGSIPHRLKPDVRVIAHEPFECLWYETMEQEIRSILDSFMDYLDNRNFYSFLKPAIDESTFF